MKDKIHCFFIQVFYTILLITIIVTPICQSGSSSKAASSNSPPPSPTQSGSSSSSSSSSYYSLSDRENDLPPRYHPMTRAERDELFGELFGPLGYGPKRNYREDATNALRGAIGKGKGLIERVGKWTRNRFVQRKKPTDVDVKIIDYRKRKGNKPKRQEKLVFIQQPTFDPTNPKTYSAAKISPFKRRRRKRAKQNEIKTATMSQQHPTRTIEQYTVIGIDGKPSTATSSSIQSRQIRSHSDTEQRREHQRERPTKRIRTQ